MMKYNDEILELNLITDCIVKYSQIWSKQFLIFINQ